MTLRGRRWTVTRLLGTVAGVKTSGNLAYEPARPNEAAALVSPDVSRAEEAVSGPAIAQAPTSQPQVTGDLAFDRLTLGELTALALGAPAAPKPGALWSDAKFGAAPLNPPPTTVSVKIGALDLGNGVAAQPFAAALRSR